MGDQPYRAWALAAAAMLVAWAPFARATWVEGSDGAEDSSWVGDAVGDRAGSMLAGIGDVDVDGHGDLVIGAPMGSVINDEGLELPEGGLVYLVLGQSEGESLDVPLDNVLFVIFGEAAEDHFGSAATALEDLDGDDVPELVVSAPDQDGAGADSGTVYVFDIPTLLESVGEYNSASDASSMFLGAAPGDRAGVSVAVVGDVDLDGAPDFVIGAPGVDVGDENRGAAYIVSGAGHPWGHAGLGLGFTRLVGEAGGDLAGMALAGGVDLDGDGLPDLVVGAPGADSLEGGEEGGRTYVVSGSEDLGQNWNPTANLGVIATWSFVADHSKLRAGFAVAALDDLDGDGRADLAIGAPGDDLSGEDAGAVYLFLGRYEGYEMGTALSTADAIFTGEAAADLAGATLAAPGDVNGDGLDELWVGAYGHDGLGTAAGAAYLILGRDQSQLGVVPLTGIATLFRGELANDQFGYAVAAAGDLDGDGLSDLLVGAPGNDQGGGTPGDLWDGAGKAYAIRGWQCWDQDADGVPSSECGGADCDDTADTVYPGADEDCSDGLDNDCDGAIDADDSDCDGDDDDAGGDDDDTGQGPGNWGGGGLVCEPGTTPGAALPLPLLLLAAALRLRRR